MRHVHLRRGEGAHCDALVAECGRDAHLLKVDAHDLAPLLKWPHFLACNLQPGPGEAAEVQHGTPLGQDMKLLVHLQELEGRTGEVVAAFGLLEVKVVEDALVVAALELPALLLSLSCAEAETWVGNWHEAGP